MDVGVRWLCVPGIDAWLCLGWERGVTDRQTCYTFQMEMLRGESAAAQTELPQGLGLRAQTSCCSQRLKPLCPPHKRGREGDSYIGRSMGRGGWRAAYQDRYLGGWGGGMWVCLGICGRLCMEKGREAGIRRDVWAGDGWMDIWRGVPRLDERAQNWAQLPDHGP